MAAAVIAIGASVAGGAAAAGFAVGTLAYAAVSSVVAFGVQTLAGSLLGDDGAGRGEQRSSLDQGLLVNSTSNVAAIPVIYGYRRVGGTRVFGPEVGGSPADNTTGNETLHQIIVMSEGPIQGYDQVYLDDLPWNDAHFRGVSGDLQSYVDTAIGSDTQVAMPALAAWLSTRWTPAHRLLGTAYVYARATWDASQEPQNIFNGVPVVTADVRGRTLYDPRTSTTAWSDNPALVIRDYLTSTRYGRGLPESSIDDAAIIEAANYCDQLVSTPSGMQSRYVCNGVLDTDQTPLANLRELLSCCRGFLVFAGGVYRLRLDKPEVASFAFTEDNIVGAWQISLGDKRARANRVSARYFNAARRWQPDLVVVDSSALRTADNGLLLEREINLPYTYDAHRAAQIAQQELKQSRQSIVATFRATIEATRVEVGDVVSITHPTPGWEEKKFRVLRLSLRADDEVEVTAREYDESVYTLDDLEAEPAEPDTSLPDPFAVAAPGVPSATESLYVTRDGGGVKAKAVITWAAAPDAFVAEYEVQYRAAGASVWTGLTRTAATVAEALDLAPGVYELRVRAWNALGSASDYATGSAELHGLLAAPTEPQGLSMQAAGGLAILRWLRSEDLDVRIGGRIEFRHSPVQAGATWVASASIGDAVSGAETVTVLPLKPGTYLAKAVDSAGVRSVAAASVVTKGASVLAFSTLATVTEHTAFSGAKSGTVAASGVLKLDSGGLVDTWADVDAVSNWDGEGGVLASGTYSFAAGMDLTTVKRVRLRTLVSATQVDALSLIDDRPDNVDAWEDWDGDSAGAVADAQVWVRETDDDPAGTPTWSAWQRLESGEFEARAFQCQARLSTSDPAYNIEVDELSVTAEEVS